MGCRLAPWRTRARVRPGRGNQPGRHARRRRSSARRAGLVLIGLVVVALAALALLGQGRSAAVAAPGSHDGLSRVALARPPDLVGDPAPAAEPAVAAAVQARAA